MEKGKLNGTYTIRYKNGMIETYNYRLGERIWDKVDKGKIIHYEKKEN